MARLRKFVIACHRWLGSVFCLLFAMWFFSGIAMMYWDFPVVSDADRLAHSGALDPASIHVSPEQALAALNVDGPPRGASLAMLDGRPAYRFRFGQDDSVVYADRGETPGEVSQATALRIASEWTRRPPAAAHFDGVLTGPDQWTVSGEFASLRPLYKFSWLEGDQVYVSPVSAQVEQYTTRASRIGAYFGPIPHWLYFTSLRKDARHWSLIVIWASGAGTVASLLGLVVGIWISVPAGRIPYSGWKRWHAILGLIFGLITCTWAFSGMLSMDPFGWDSGADDGAQSSALRGSQWRADAFADKSPAEAIRQTGRQTGHGVKELELAFFAGQPVYFARGDAPPLIVPVHGEPTSEFDPARIAEAIAIASRPSVVVEARVVREYEPYYIDRHNGRPLPALFVRLDDHDDTMFYIDLKTARIVQSYTALSRWNRWLYHGLHSMDLPWLYRHRPAWDILVLALLLGGAAVSVTSVVLAWRFLARKLYTTG